MELEISDLLKSLSTTTERLAEVASELEKAVTRLEQCGVRHPEVGKITAAVDTAVEVSPRELELERKLLQVEQALTTLQAQNTRELVQEKNKASLLASVRKTLPSATVQLLAKQGIDTGDSVDVQSLDAALAGLSVEQRIAVKSQMLRAGTLVR